MYCAKKGAECGYLGLFREMKETLPVERAFATEHPESLYGELEDRFDKAMSAVEAVDCSKDFCAVVGYAITTAIESEVRIQRMSDGR